MTVGGSPLRERLRRGERLAGLFVQAPHPVVPELLGMLGLDVVCLDAEHAPIGPETMHALVGGAILGGVPALVRVADATAAHIGGALDAGAAGVLVPRIGGAAEAAHAVRLARYPPLGERGLGPSRSSAYGLRIAEELAAANERTLVGVQVETRAALEAVDEIVAVEGLDLVFVGSGDLAASLGLRRGVEDPALQPLVEDVVTRAAAAGKATGVLAPPERAREWFDRGVDLVLLGSDLTLLARAVTNARSALSPRAPST